MTRKIILSLLAVVLLIGGLAYPGLSTGKQSSGFQSGNYHKINSQIIAYLFAAYNTEFATFTGKEGFPYMTESAQETKLQGLDKEVKLVKANKLSNRISSIKIHEISFDQKGGASAKVSFEIAQLKNGSEQAKASVLDVLELRWQTGQWLIEDEKGQLQPG